MSMMCERWDRLRIILIVHEFIESLLELHKLSTLFLRRHRIVHINGLIEPQTYIRGLRVW